MAATGSLITDRVKQLVRMRGPVIPVQISKEIGTNILMASAILSELASKSEVKISSVKFGGTPLYYVPGQEQKLQNYLSNLHQKEREAFEQLKASGVLKDASLDPAIRVALRQIKDFAKPIEASADGNIELFWKWYLLSNEEAEPVIKKIMGLAEEKAAVTPSSAVPKAVQIEPVVGTHQAAQPAIQPTSEPQLYQQQTTLAQQPGLAAEKSSSQLQQPQTILAAPPASVVKTRKSPLLQQKPSDDVFSRMLDEFFAKNNIEIESVLPPMKSERGYVVLLPSSVGKLRYYCIAKNKKTCTDSDISSALVQGQLRKLPVLLLAKGELTKKAQELISKEIGAIVIKKI